MGEQNTTMGADFPREQERVRELLVVYEEIGSAGMFGAAVLRQALKEADEAVISGDIVRLLGAYQKLKECE